MLLYVIAVKFKNGEKRKKKKKQREMAHLFGNLWKGTLIEVKARALLTNWGG
jgi:hypothetical protein